MTATLVVMAIAFSSAPWFGGPAPQPDERFEATRVPPKRQPLDHSDGADTLDQVTWPNVLVASEPAVEPRSQGIARRVDSSVLGITRCESTPFAT